MSEDLFKQWNDRVLETETELNLIQEEIDGVLREQKNLKKKANAAENRIAKEKQDLLRELEDVEAKAKELTETCDRTLREKEKVEEIYTRTLDEYESMHFLVHEIKDAEQELAEREDYDVKLQKESLEWAEEEHSLRTKLNNLQIQLKQQRKRQQAEITELEAELAEAEKALARDRASRTGDVKEQARSLMRSSRPPSPSKAQKDFMLQHGMTGAPVRPCLKTAASVPVSRAPSQALGQEGERNTLDALAQLRAASYGANKQSRKRTLLGDSTNQN